jgi:hypothetical protein
MTTGPDLKINVAEIEQLEDYLQQATLAGDVAILEKYLDDRLNAVDPFGRRMDKQGTLDFYRSGILDLAQIEQSERTITLMDNAAAVSWFGRLSGTYYGESFSEKLAYSRVWSRHNGKWSLILIHSTRITM